VVGAAAACAAAIGTLAYHPTWHVAPLQCPYCVGYSPGAVRRPPVSVGVALAPVSSPRVPTTAACPVVAAYCRLRPPLSRGRMLDTPCLPPSAAPTALVGPARLLRHLLRLPRPVCLRLLRLPPLWARHGFYTRSA